MLNIDINISISYNNYENILKIYVNKGGNSNGKREI